MSEIDWKKVTLTPVDAVMDQNSSDQPTNLSRSLGPVMLWGLGVGYVISGMYFGWNLGLPQGGTLGLGIATLITIIMYVTFTFSYTELACALPKAGGAFVYAGLALGPFWGHMAGIAQIIEFVFAPPAIASAIGTYLHIFLPQFSVLQIAISSYLLFTALNIYGVKAAATFELVVTIFAVVELLIFGGLTLPHFQWQNFTHNPLPQGISGIFAAIPFAIWFFLAIEGVANVAEETRNPQHNVKLGLGWAMATLIGLCLLTYFAAIGVGGWENIVYETQGAAPSDSPLPLALGQLLQKDHFYYHLLITIGIFGLVASFHGIILAAGRATMEFGRAGHAPSWTGKVQRRFKTPANALIINMVIGICALCTGKTGEIIVVACFGAISLYILSMLALLQLRRKMPDLPRPFMTPCYPWFPLLALGLATVAGISMVVYYPSLALIYTLMLLLSVLWYQFFVTKKI